MFIILVLIIMLLQLIYCTFTDIWWKENEIVQNVWICKANIYFSNDVSICNLLSVKCVSMNNQECKIRPEILNINLWPSGLGNFIVCKRFAVQTLLWSLEFVIQINFEHNTIAVSNLAQSWSISTFCNVLTLESTITSHYTWNTILHFRILKQYSTETFA